MKKSINYKIAAMLLAAVMCISVCSGFTTNAQETDDGTSQQVEQTKQPGQAGDTGQVEGSLPGESKKETNSQEAPEADRNKGGTADITKQKAGGVSEAFETQESWKEKDLEAQELSEQSADTAETQEPLLMSASDLSNPRIEKASGMAAGQKVTWDCVWFGRYPQAEVVPSADNYTSVDKSTLRSGDIVENSSLYNKLQSAQGGTQIMILR